MLGRMTCCGCCCKGGVAGSCLGALWMLLSLVTTLLSCMTFYVPYWLQGTIATSSATTAAHRHDNGDVIPTYLGIWRRCNFLRAGNDSIEVVMECGRYASFMDIPSLWWQIGTVTLGTGCGLLLMVMLFNFIGCCCSDVITTTSSRICAYFQLLAGVLLGAGLALFPLGWKDPEVRRICGKQANIYSTGDCDVIWGMWAAIGGAAAAILCAILGCSVSSPSKKPEQRASFRQSRDNYMHVSTQ